MPSEFCTLVLSFIDDSIERGRIRISTESELSRFDSVSWIVPEYVIKDDSQGITYVNDISHIDGVTPIQVFTGNSNSLSPILLLENTPYQIAVSGDAESAFDYLHKNSGEISLNKLHFKSEKGEDIYLLKFEGYVGKGYFDMTFDGRIIKIPVEVRSRKLGYLTDYPLMLSDIAEFSTMLLMNAKSPLHTYYDVSDHRGSTSYEDFLVLDYLFSKLDLPGMYHYVRENRHTELISRSERVQACLASDVDPSDIISIVCGDNLIPFDDGPILGSYAPETVCERRWEDYFDTPENRIVKDLILSADGMIMNLLASEHASKSDYIINRLCEMKEFTENTLKDQWLNEIGEIRMIPYDSSVLRSRFGYADLFHMYQMLGLGAAFKQKDAENILAGHNKKLHIVYEYWCYTRLYKCLSDLSDEPPKFPLDESENRWTIDIRKEKTAFCIRLEETILDVDLYYNRNFSEGSEKFRSYSVRLRPDFTLRVVSSSDPDRAYIVNFDAKYKAKPLSDEEIDVETEKIGADSWEYDICKMHTYRDALIHSCGSYVLFPGTRTRIYRKPWDQKNWNDRDSSFIPSVGAIPLVPGDDDNYELNSAMTQILRKISDLSSGRIAADDIRNYLF